VLKLRDRAPKSPLSEAFVVPLSRGQHRCDRQGKGTSVRPGSKSGAKAQDGSPGYLRDPIGVHVKSSALRATDSQMPGPGGGLQPLQERHGGHKRQEDHVDDGSEKK
jgi:hypothetical protein